MQIKRVAIALAAYEPNVKFFAEQLKSIQDQSFTGWICVLTLDSPLASLRSEAALAHYFADSRFVWIENPMRLGHKRNFEKAIQLCLERGVDAIGCSDQDDVWYSEKLAKSVAALEKAGPLSLVHCDMHIMKEREIESQTAWQIEKRGVHNTYPEHLFVRNVVAGCSMLIDAELVRRFPRIPEAADYHDHWYALVASFYGGVHPIRQPLFAYRQHEVNVVGMTPYRGLFWMPKTSAGGVLEKVQRCWSRSHELALAAKEEGLPLTSKQIRAFVFRKDLGASLFFLGLKSIGSDQALARACFARAAGKPLSLVHSMT